MGLFDRFRAKKRQREPENGPEIAPKPEVRDSTDKIAPEYAGEDTPTGNSANSLDGCLKRYKQPDSLENDGAGSGGINADSGRGSMDIDEYNLREKIGNYQQIAERRNSCSELLAENLFRRVVVVRDFFDGDYAASGIWQYFSSRSNIERIGEKLSYTGTIEGSPQLSRLENSVLYPKMAVFDARLEESSYRVFLENSLTGEFRVKIECDLESICEVERLLDSCRRQTLTLVKKTAAENYSLVQLYEFLQVESESMALLPSKQENDPIMCIDACGQIYPCKAKIKAVLDGETYVFGINSEAYGLEVKVEFPDGQMETAKAILERFNVKQAQLAVQIEADDEVQPAKPLYRIKKQDWSSLGGLGSVKDELIRYIVWPLNNPKLFGHLQLAPPKGIMLVGPPGNGKTTIAKVIASETESSFYAVSPKDINSRYVGDTEKNWGELFRMAREDVSRGGSAIIFIDEIDGFYSDREEMDKYSRIAFSQLCQEIDGLRELSGIVLISATNRADLLDPALLRPGRFTKKIYIGDPDAQARKEILQIYLGRQPLAENINLERLADQTGGYCGAKIKELCDLAAYTALENFCRREDMAVEKITPEMFKGLTIREIDYQHALAKIDGSKKQK